ncbi:hypothetical protein [Sphingobium yanoikuyae]|uniref:hypothetical protein n=1 Tax=Sphingobium yanoikuyae TaxID=13690 RepID=UPI0035B25168
MNDNSLRGEDDESDTAFAEASITLWSNLVALIGTHMLETGMPRQELLDLLTLLHETNEETIRSPRARTIAGRHLMSVYRALGDA